jgi:hypothetical protein
VSYVGEVISLNNSITFLCTVPFNLESVSVFFGFEIVFIIDFSKKGKSFFEALPNLTLEVDLMHSTNTE